MTNALILLSKPFIEDPRVTREARSLSQNGHAITILSWGRKGANYYRSATEHGTEFYLIGPAIRNDNFLSFFVKLVFFWLSCLKLSKKRNFSLVHANDLDTLPLGFLISRLKRTKLVYDAHESYPDMVANDVPGIVTTFLRRAERWLIRRSDFVIAENPRTADHIGALDAIVVMNCPSASEIPTEAVRSIGASKPLTLGCFASIEPGRFILEAIEVISQKADWKFIIAGDGLLEKAVREAACSAENVVYLGRQPHEEVMRQSMRCDAMLVIFDPTNMNNVIAGPNRLFEAMALGIPPVVTGNTYGAEIVMNERSGYICDYDKKSFSKLLDSLASSTGDLNERGKQGRESFIREYNWENQVSRLIKIYSEILCK